MALSAKIQQALNEQINYELYSAYIYAAMSADMTSKNLPGAANWFRQQAHEEILHGMKQHDYLLNRDGEVKLAAIEAPPSSWETPVAAFTHALEHERSVTARLSTIFELAVAEKDPATQNLMRWFIDEQVEEEASVNDLVHKLKLVGSDGAGVYMVDQELAGRAAPAPLDAKA